MNNTFEPILFTYHFFPVQLQRLLELREFCDTLPDKDFPRFSQICLSLDEWIAVEKIIKILGPFERLTTTMQKQTISLSDFFGGWAKIKLELSKMDSDELIKNLLSQMQFRETVLFNNPVPNAAVFLDPRYQKYMPNEKKQVAINFLKLLDGKVNLLKQTLRQNATVPSNYEPDELDEFLSTIYGEPNNNILVSENDDSNPDVLEDNIETTLKNFEVV